MNTQARSESAITTIVIAAFLGLLAMDYAVSATEAPLVGIPAVTVPLDVTPTTYFPSQFVNQGQTLEEHIQAF